MKQIIAISVSVLTAACAPVMPDINYAQGWSMRCHTNQTTAVRNCMAIHEPSLLKIVYHGPHGPYVYVGHHTHPTISATVRIDGNDPVRLTNANPYLIGQQDGQRRAEARKVISQMRAGQVVRAEEHHWPSGSRTKLVELKGFADAVDRLEAEVHAPPAVSALASDRARKP